MKIAGIDGCKLGWFYVGFKEDGSVSFGVIKYIADLSQFFDTMELVLIDIPIGLRDKHPDQRQCDVQARAALKPKRHSSVFTPPSRSVLDCDSYTEANQRNRESTGKGLSRQSWNIVPKIKEVDAFLRGVSEPHRFCEMHPEVCFWALNHCQVMDFNKKTRQGYEERLAVLMRYYPGARELIASAMQTYKRAEVARDDIVDALVGAVTARQSGSLAAFPVTPEVDDTGLPMKIIYWVSS